jgi:hypothetical protein
MGLELSAQKTRSNAYFAWLLTERIPTIAARRRPRTTGDYSGAMRAANRRSGVRSGAVAGSSPGLSRSRAAPAPPRFRDLGGALSEAVRRVSARAGMVITPLRAALAVASLAAVALAVSQFLDYRGVAIGAGDYAAYPDIEPIAPAPQVDREVAGSAHAYLLLPVAIAALVALAFALRGRSRLARLAAALGAFSLVVVLIVDRPAGLDEGVTTVRFEGAEARLEYGFYVELAASVVLVAASLIAARYGRIAEARERRLRSRAAARNPRLWEVSG